MACCCESRRSFTTFNSLKLIKNNCAGSAYISSYLNDNINRMNYETIMSMPLASRNKYACLPVGQAHDSPPGQAVRRASSQKSKLYTDEKVRND